MSADRPNRLDGTSPLRHPSIWLVSFTLALLCGQAIAAAPWAIPPQATMVAPLPLLLGLRAGGRRWALLYCAVAVAFTLGYVRHRQLLDPNFPAHHLRAVTRDGATLYLEGWLRQEPEKLANRSRWLVRVERVWHPTGAEEITGDMLVGLRNVRREWRYGDQVRFQVRPQAPRDSGNPGGFDYAAYLASRAIYVTAFLDGDNEVELLARRPNPVRGAIETLRREIRRYIDRSFSPQRRALMNALVVGDMGEIPKEMRADFTAAGVNHVLSISGLHVGMLGLVAFAAVRLGCGLSVFMLLRFNLLKIATFCSFMAVVFYTALAGAMVPTVRSAIMIGVYELAVLLDREEEVLISLTFAALLIALVWPGVVADISFQLSFVAVLAIAWGVRQARAGGAAPRQDALPQERIWWRKSPRQLGSHLVVPLLATIGTGPLIAHYFGHLSLAGFLSNPLIVPLVGFVVVPIGLLIGFLALTVPVAAAPLVWVAEQLLALTIWLVRGFAHLPLANIGVPAPNLAEVLLVYLLLVILALRRMRYAALAAAIVAALLCADAYYWWGERWQRRDLRITFLNVGQGDAAVVELPGSSVMVIDAGGTATGEFDTGEAIVGPFLRARKILRIDYLVLSHARVDHYGGMSALVKEFSPREFWSGAAKGKTARFEDLEEALARAKIPRAPLHAQGPCWNLQAVRLCALYPLGDDGSDAPAVLRLEFGNLRFLFSSDIDKRDEAVLLRKVEEIRSAAMTVPRHGGATASTREFIAGVGPKLAVVSAGARSRSGPQREETLDRYREAGAEVLLTYEDGAVIIESDGATLRYRGHKSGKRGTIELAAQ